MRPAAETDLAKRLRAGTLELGTAFAFFSGLYFRGKLGYSRHFGNDEATFIITPTRGLMKTTELVNPDVIREFASLDVAEGDHRYRKPLERDVRALAKRMASRTRVVLLGSVSSGKYVDVLQPLLGDRLCYPSSFIGRGDMSRGGLLLRCVADNTELEYQSLAAGVRPKGSRPPRLDPTTRPKPYVVR
jgi:hypothetical protein